MRVACQPALGRPALLKLVEIGLFSFSTLAEMLLLLFFIQNLRCLPASFELPTESLCCLLCAAVGSFIN